MNKNGHEFEDPSKVEVPDIPEPEVPLEVPKKLSDNKDILEALTELVKGQKETVKAIIALKVEMTNFQGKAKAGRF